MVEQVLIHRVRFFGQVLVTLALEIIGDPRRHLAALDREQRLVLLHHVADAHLQIQHLARQRSQHSRGPVLVELHLSGCGEQLVERLLPHLFNPNVGHHVLIHLDGVRTCRIDGFEGGSRSGGSNLALLALVFHSSHGIPSWPATDASRVAARR